MCTCSEREQRRRKVNETRDYIANYLRDHAAYLKEEQRRMAEEDRKIQEYAEQKRRLQEEDEKRKNAKKFEMDRIYEEVRACELRMPICAHVV